MKKNILILNGSRQKNGNTAKFIKSIVNRLEDFSIEIAHPQDFSIEVCKGCNQCFSRLTCIQQDDLSTLQQKILDSDCLILASPVYLHYMTSELKLILDRCSWWAHTLRLQGKPVVVLSTCASNGHTTVINSIGNIMNIMGGNVIATANAAAIPNQINNTDWLDEVSNTISERIKKYTKLPPQSNSFIERTFSAIRLLMIEEDRYCKENNLENGELEFWRNTGMLKFDSFADYLKELNKENIDYESTLSTTK